ncbi:MAG TPA: hypothetical protein VM889_10875 [Candidatus Thermoplasmatota archaeon]|nr:hypothetical protein [Candidatus Thermoplasmatota archaeon]
MLGRRTLSLGGRDGGHVQVLEAVLIGLVMFTAVSFVLTYSLPTSETAPTRNRLENAGVDALNVLYEYPLADARYGNNTLSKLIADALSGDCSGLDARFKAFLPAGTLYNLYMSNGYGATPLCIKGSPEGETATATHLIEPKWSFTFYETAVDYHDPARSHMRVYALPVYNSNLVPAGGVPVEITVRGVYEGLPVTFRTAGSTYQGDASYTSAIPSVDMKLLDESLGIDAGYLDLEPVFKSGPAYSEDPATVKLEVENRSPNAPLPAGTQLTIQVPRGFTAVADYDTNIVEGWHVTGNVTSPNAGGQVTATLLSSVTGAPRVFTLTLGYPGPGDLLDFYLFSARLSKGAYSSLDFVVKADSHASAPTAVPLLAAGVPKPMGVVNPSTWPLVLTNPFASPLYIREIEFRQPDGYPIFHKSTTTSDLSCGNWLHANVFGPQVAFSAITWRWEPTGFLPWDDCANGKIVPPGEAFRTTLEAFGTGTLTPRSPEDPLPVPISFDGHSTKLWTNLDPMFYQGLVPPRGSVVNGMNAARQGYDFDANNLRVPEAFSGAARFREAFLTGNWTYTSEIIPTLEEALATGSINISKRRIAVGESIDITPDVRSLIHSLSKKNSVANVTTRIYGPFSIEHHKAIYTDYNDPTALVNGSVNALLADTVDDDATTDVIVGTSSGRVSAHDGLDGSVLVGRVFTVETLAQFAQQKQAAEVTHLAGIPINGKLHYAVGTDEKSAYVYVLDKNFTVVRQWTKPISASVNWIDAGQDLNGDGVKDVVVTFDANRIYALSGVDWTTLPNWPVITGGEPKKAVGGVFGFPALPGVVGHTGLHASASARVYSQVTPDVMALYMNLVNTANSVSTSFGTSTLDAYNHTVHPNHWRFGIPSGDVAAYDLTSLNGDSVTDIIVGGTDGIVYALDGRQAGPPVSDVSVVGPPMGVRAAWIGEDLGWALLEDGEVIYTIDGWTDMFYSRFQGLTRNPLPGARNIFFKDVAHGYVVGAPSRIYASTDGGASFNPALTVTVKNPATGLPSAAVWNFNDIAITADGHGVMVGNRCVLVLDSLCGDAAIFHTETANDFTKWRKYSSGGYASGALNSTLEFRGVAMHGPGRGVAIGDRGAMRCLSPATGATSWRTVVTGTTRDLTDVALVNSDHAVAVGKGGIVLNITGLANCTPTVTNLSAKLSTSLDLESVAVRGSRIVIGGPGLLYESIDLGRSFARQPGLDADTSIRALHIPYEGRAIGIGGNTTAPATGLHVVYMGTFRMHSTAVSTNYGIPAVPPGNRITLVRPETVVSNELAGLTNTKLWVSTNNGVDWIEATLLGAGPDNLGYPPYAPVAIPWEKAGTSFKWKLEMFINENWTHIAPSAKSLNFTLESSPEATPWATVPLTVVRENFADPGRAAFGTNVVWDVQGRIRPQVIRPVWATQVTGEIVEIDASRDFTADGQKDVVIATRYQVVSGVPNPQQPDYRVMLLDGKTGEVKWKTGMLLGWPIAIKVIDANLQTGDSVPDVVAVMWTPTMSLTWVYYLDGVDGDTLTMFSFGGGERPTALAAGHLDRTPREAIAFVGTTSINTTGQTRAFRESSALLPNWGVLPSDDGLYSFTYKVPLGAPYGPYVIETEVSWQESNLVQAGRVYNYFIVTPPDGRLPVSPVYDLKLVTWYEDWDRR